MLMCLSEFKYYCSSSHTSYFLYPHTDFTVLLIKIPMSPCHLCVGFNKASPYANEDLLLLMKPVERKKILDPLIDKVCS